MRGYLNPESFIPGPSNALPSNTQGGSRMPKSGTFGSVRGVLGNRHSYRDQFFSGMAYYEPRLPCDATQIGRFRRVLGEVPSRYCLKEPS